VVALRPLQVTLDDVCFCHWPVSEAAVRAAVPDWLTVETAENNRVLEVRVELPEAVEPPEET